MTSRNAPASLPPHDTENKNTATISVRMPVQLARLVRQAAAKRDTTRSAFMAAAAVTHARMVMELQRDADFQAYLDAA